jgi:hypothetical protein
MGTRKANIVKRAWIKIKKEIKEWSDAISALGACVLLIIVMTGCTTTVNVSILTNRSATAAGSEGRKGGEVWADAKTDGGGLSGNEVEVPIPIMP